MPAFWLTLIIYFTIPAFHEREALPSIWRFLTFTQNFGLDVWHMGTFSHAWSLCVEEHFYLFLPLIVITLQHFKIIKHGIWIIVLIFIAGFFIRHFCWSTFYFPKLNQQGAGIEWYRHIYYPTYNRLDGLLAGVSIAALREFLPELWNRISKYGNIFLLVGLATLTGAYYLCEDEQSYQASVFCFPLVAIGYAMLVISAISQSSIMYKSKSRITTFIAATSFAVYLTHKGVVHVTQQILANFEIDITNNLTLIISTLASFAVAYVVYLLVEKPFMKWRNKLLNT